LKQGVEVWNNWREENRGIEVDLSLADLNGADLRDVDFNKANLKGVNLSEANLSNANLREATLSKAFLSGANFSRADFSDAHLTESNLKGAHLRQAIFRTAFLWGANLSGADLREAYLNRVQLEEAQLEGADLSKANLGSARLGFADLSRTNLCETDLSGANLWGTDLRDADLTGADLQGAILVGTKIDKTKISRSSVYGVNVWDLEGELEEQKDLIITRRGEPIITVDNIKVAQFIYLILNNEEIRDVINTLTSKSVLILGRFSIPERKGILDALRNKLREFNLLPIVFDFDRPTDKDFTETIKTLAGLSYFVIADITKPKSSPLELQATVPDYQIPFVPIIQEGEQPFAMMVDLQKKYNWVLDTLSYSSIDTLIEALKPAIIDPAIAKHNELRLIKAREPKIRSVEDFIGNKS
jgi:uncharacterized protein YjbI with pentapeptide repeats